MESPMFYRERKRKLVERIERDFIALKQDYDILFEGKIDSEGVMHLTVGGDRLQNESALTFVRRASELLGLIEAYKELYSGYKGYDGVLEACRGSVRSALDGLAKVIGGSPS